jgi:hypothetical protein
MNNRRFCTPPKLRFGGAIIQLRVPIPDGLILTSEFCTPEFFFNHILYHHVFLQYDDRTKYEDNLAKRYLLPELIMKINNRVLHLPLAIKR